MDKLIHESISRLDNWLEKNGWSGYDPYDIKGTSFFIRTLQSDSFYQKRLLKHILFRLETIFPLQMRRMFRIEKRVNAKGMGLLASAYLQLYLTAGDVKYLAKASQLIDWLDNNYSQGYSGMCWGYPFDWQSRIFIPQGMPSAVVSSIIGDAYWKFYLATGEKKYLDTCNSICAFFLSNLNIDKIKDDIVCFSYTPLDHFHVHNANLFVAEFLLRIGKELSIDDYIRTGLQAANYALSEQNEDGSISYWGRDQSDKVRVDHYHSGFEIRSLYSIWKITGEHKFLEAARKYYHFYLSNFYVNKTIPKMTPNSVYPIDIHSCAEAVLCNSTLLADFPEGLTYLKNTMKWTIQNMQTEDGWFIYRVYKTAGIEYKASIPYIRWGQAWMMKALSTVLTNAMDERIA